MLQALIPGWIPQSLTQTDLFRDRHLHDYQQKTPGSYFCQKN
jgi:hypothetical protein